MRRFVIPTKDIYIDGKLSFLKDTEYELFRNGTSGLMNEFIISYTARRGAFLFHLPSSDYEIKEIS